MTEKELAELLERERLTTTWVVIDDLGFTTRGLARRPLWVKSFTSILDDRAYLSLDAETRGVWCDVKLAFLADDGRLRAADVPDILALDVEPVARALWVLEEAGFLQLSNEKPASLTERESKWLEEMAAAFEPEAPAA